MTIHLVEDNPDMLESLRLLLEIRGYEVRTYLRALDLVDRIDTIGDDDVVISDYYLPDINGVALMRRVRQSRPRVRSVLLTGSRENGIAASVKALPRVAVLYKPLDIDTLEKCIKESR